MDEGPEAIYLAVGHLPAPSFGEVADTQHQAAHGGVLEEVGGHELDELPPITDADPELERRPEGLVLDAREGDRGQFLVLGVDDVQGVRPH